MSLETLVAESTLRITLVQFVITIRNGSLHGPQKLIISAPQGTRRHRTEETHGITQNTSQDPD